MLLNNEFLFLLQIIIIGIFLLLFAKKENTLLFLSMLTHIFIFLNLMSAHEIKLFSIHCSIVEPFGILMYFMTIFLYSWDKKIIDKFFKIIYIINSFLFIIFIIMINYNYINDNTIIIILKEYLYNTLISLISFNISYYIERKAFNFLHYIDSPLRESYSVSIGQFFDTVFYTILIFFNRSYTVIIQIIFCSYIIKLFCIISYTLFLFYKKRT